MEKFNRKSFWGLIIFSSFWILFMPGQPKFMLLWQFWWKRRWHGRWAPCKTSYGTVSSYKKIYIAWHKCILKVNILSRISQQLEFLWPRKKERKNHNNKDHIFVWFFMLMDANCVVIFAIIIIIFRILLLVSRFEVGWYIRHALYVVWWTRRGAALVEVSFWAVSWTQKLIFGGDKL